MSYFECSKCNEKHHIFGSGGAERISEKHNIPFLGAIPLNSGIMEGSDLGKPVMMTQPNSPRAEAFTVAAKNIAAQCSIVAAKLQEEMQAETTPSTTQNFLKLPENLRDQLKIPLGYLIKEENVNK